MLLHPNTRVSFSATSAVALDANKVPRQSYRKELIRTGQFVKDSENLDFEVTSDTLKHWAASFQQMKQNGVKVPIPNTHAAAGDADQNRGYVTDMFVVDDSLVMTCEMIGREGIEAAAKCDVSIWCPPKLRDGDGNEYKIPIEHVALCTDPVITGLGDFIPLAASKRAKEPNMDLTKIKKALSIAEELTLENAEALILSAHEALTKKLTTLGEQFDAFKATAGDKTPKPDAALVSLSADNRNMKLAALVEAARITPAVRDKLAKLFVDEAPLTLALSNGTAGLFNEIVEALRENDPVKLGESSKAQTLALSSPIVSDEKNPLMADAQQRLDASKA